jgi:uncharacterized protein
MKLTDAEKLMLTMLCDIYEKLGIDKGVEPKFVMEAISTDNAWALKWQYTGIFTGPSETPDHVREVVDILDMWHFIEFSHGALTPEEKLRVKTEAAPFGEPHFDGFDGNNEAELITVARLLIDYMDRFSDFKGRDLNSHCPSIDSHRRMLSVYTPLRPSLTRGPLSAAQLIDILKERVHPENRK